MSDGPAPKKTTRRRKTLKERDTVKWDSKPRTAKKQPEGDRATGARIFRTSGPATGTRDELRLFSNVHYLPQHGELTVHRRSKKNPHIGGRTRRGRKTRSTRRR